MLLDSTESIVAQINSLFSKLKDAESGLKNAKKKLEIYRHTLLKKAFSGELTKKWRQDKNLDAYEELINVQKKGKNSINQS